MAATAVDPADRLSARSAPGQPAGRGCNPPRAPRRAPETPWGRLRNEVGWSLRELEERTGINRGDLSKFERGRGCPTPDQAMAIVGAVRGVGR